VFITALPQSTAEVEITLSHLNNNKNKLKYCLAVCTLETIIKSSENFPGDFEVKTKTYSMHLYGTARKTYFENPEAVGAITDETFFPCELHPAGELQGSGIMLKIYCERCWLILEILR